MPVHLLSGDCIEIATYEQRNVGGRGTCGTAGVFLDQILEVSQEVGALGAAEPLPARTSLKVGHSHAHASPRAPTT